MRSPIARALSLAACLLVGCAMPKTQGELLASSYRGSPACADAPREQVEQQLEKHLSSCYVPYEAYKERVISAGTTTIFLPGGKEFVPARYETRREEHQTRFFVAIGASYLVSVLLSSGDASCKTKIDVVAWNLPWMGSFDSLRAAARGEPATCWGGAKN